MANPSSSPKRGIEPDGGRPPGGAARAGPAAPRSRRPLAGRPLRHIAGITLGTSATFLLLVAVLINAPGLFFMSTAMLATMGAARLQAWLAVRALRIERLSPPAVRVGDLVSVDLVLWSERRIKRPLVVVHDELPEGLRLAGRTPSLPVAPSFDQPIHTRYSFRPQRRGTFAWSRVVVEGTDALGLTTMRLAYETEPATLTVYPAPVPVSLPVKPGIVEADLQRRRGAGIEPRGVREYAPGDLQRHVHWPSSARTGSLMVKEFDAGFGLAALFVVQRSAGSDIGDGAWTTLEAMCGHAMYLAEQFLRQGVAVAFPSIEPIPDTRQAAAVRRREIAELLAHIRADQQVSVAAELEAIGEMLPEGAALYLMLSVAEPDLPPALRALKGLQRYCLVYDPKEYPARGRPAPSAAAPEFVAQLRAAGCEVILMPRVEGLA
jgi:uncharacterized protein (DUF58 family)